MADFPAIHVWFPPSTAVFQCHPVAFQTWYSQPDQPRIALRVPPKLASPARTVTQRQPGWDVLATAYASTLDFNGSLTYISRHRAWQGIYQDWLIVSSFHERCHSYQLLPPTWATRSAVPQNFWKQLSKHRLRVRWDTWKRTGFHQGLTQGTWWLRVQMVQYWCLKRSQDVNIDLDG